MTPTSQNPQVHLLVSCVLTRRLGACIVLAASMVACSGAITSNAPNDSPSSPTQPKPSPGTNTPDGEPSLGDDGLPNLRSSGKHLRIKNSSMQRKLGNLRSPKGVLRSDTSGALQIGAEPIQFKNAPELSAALSAHSRGRSVRGEAFVPLDLWPLRSP